VLDRIDALILTIPVVWYYWFGFAHRGCRSQASPERTKRKPGFVKQLAILGSTGSIGRQCLSVVEALPGRFSVVALAAGANLEELGGQIERHKPEVVSVGDAQKADELAVRLREKGISLPAIHHGREGMLAVGTHSAAEIVVSAAVGVVGLEATYESGKAGSDNRAVE